MPQLTLNHSPHGLILDAVIWVSLPRKLALEEARQPVPGAQQIRALVDTGASSSMIDKAILAQLRLPPIGSVLMHTPSTGPNPISCPTFDVGFFIASKVPGTWIHTIPSLQVMECDFSSHGGAYNALLGRDILGQAILHTNGPMGLFTLAF